MIGNTLAKEKNEIDIPVKDKAGNFRFIGFFPEPDNKFIGEETTKVGADSLEPDSGNQPIHRTPFSNVTANKSTDVNNDGKAKYYFDADDQSDVEKMAVAPAHPGKSEEYENAAIWLVRQLGIPLNVELQQRLVRVVISRWKEMRDDRQTKEVLTRSRDNGGLGLSQSQADNIVKSIVKDRDIAIEKGKNVNSGMLKRALVNQSAPTSVATNRVDNDIVIGEGDSQKTNGDSSKSKTSAEGGRLMTEIKPRSLPPEKTETIQPKQSKSESERETINVVGPVDELRTITLSDFRRMGKDPKTAAQKIYQKIDLLGDESLEIKAAGISAWKESDIYKDYLAIGQKSIQEGVQMDEIFKQQKNGMTKEEFDAIVDLNGKLSF